MHVEQFVVNGQCGVEHDIGPCTTLELEQWGYRRAFGFPVGQVADYRKALTDGRGIHVRVYRDRVTAHLERVDPSVDPLGHLVKDAPFITLGAAFVGAALLGAFSG